MTAPPARDERLRAVAIEAAVRATGAAGSTATITAIRAAPLGIGQLADSLRVEIDWAGSDPGPASLVAKLPAQDAKARETAVSIGAYDRECRFYAELAGRVGVRTPRFLGAVDIDGSAGGLLLEDLSEKTAAADQFAVTPDQVEGARAQLAALQADSWNDPALARLPWLHRRLGVPIPSIAARMRLSWQVARKQLAAGWPAGLGFVVDTFVERCEEWAGSLTGPACLVHHDYRVDNLLFGTGPDASGSAYVLDWQTVGWGPPMFDLAYLIGTSFTPDERRVHEAGIVRRHLDDLARRGVDWPEDDAQAAYRAAGFAVLLMLVPPIATVKSTERGSAMLAELVRRGAEQAADLGTLELLGPTG